MIIRNNSVFEHQVSLWNCTEMCEFTLFRVVWLICFRMCVISLPVSQEMRCLVVV
jgi:hypothetical protein